MICPHPRLWIPGRLPGINDIIKDKGATYGGGRSAWTNKKAKVEATIRQLADSQAFPDVGGGHFVYLFREQDKRRDPSNFTAGARKVIEDALQQDRAGKGSFWRPRLDGDGWKHVLSFQDFWMVDADRPGVTVFVTETRVTEPMEYWVEMDRKCRS